MSELTKIHLNRRISLHISHTCTGTLGTPDNASNVDDIARHACVKMARFLRENEFKIADDEPICAVGMIDRWMPNYPDTEKSFWFLSLMPSLNNPGQYYMQLSICEYGSNFRFDELEERLFAGMDADLLFTWFSCVTDGDDDHGVNVAEKITIDRFIIESECGCTTNYTVRD